MANSRAYVAEFVGTFFLCFAAIASVLSATAAVGGGGGLLAIAFAPGLALAVAVSTFGAISGAHFNPAITIGMAAVGRIGPAAAGVYVLVQLLAGVVAALLCRAFFPPDILGQTALVGLPLPAPWVSAGGVVLGEAVMTFLLMLAVFGAAVDDRGRTVKIGALAIGLTFAVNILALGAVTGASMNPARSFGPALVTGVWSLHLYYWIGPVIGAVAGAALYERLLLNRRS
jgi:MIP family channel proteins